MTDGFPAGCGGARNDGGGELRLVAYLVGEGSTGREGELRAYLKTKLPDYMVPAAFVTLDALPLTPNGKIDRKALPPPEFKSNAASFLPPRTPAEKQLAQIWCDVLRLERVGIHDNFF